MTAHNNKIEGKFKMPEAKHAAPKGEGSSKVEILKKTRIEQGLSLETVHETTKIPMDVLRAIEDGYSVRTISEFYYKGFLKIYARYLNVDVARVIDDYHVEKLPQHVTVKVDEFNLKRWLRENLTKERKRQISIVFGIILGLFILFKIINFFTHLKPGKPKKPKVVLTEKPADNGPLDDLAGENPSPAIETSPITAAITPALTNETSPVVSKNVNLTIRAKKSTWIRVKADGQTVFQSTLESGAVEAWHAQDRIEIAGKNIDQIEFELNGKMIGTLGRKDRGAKEVIITKGGLSVSK